MQAASAAAGLNAGSLSNATPQGALINKGAEALSKGMDIYADSARRQELIIRGPPPKESVSMVKYIVIAVIIISIIAIYFSLGRAWVQPPKYESVFNSFTPDRMILHPERRPAREMVSDSARLFGIMPKRPINLRV